MTSGYGPVEKDTSNGGFAGGDGLTITLNGTTYAKGLGVHAASDIQYALGSTCTRFKASVGVDDEVGANGSVVFQVFAGATKVYDSALMTGATATKTIDVSVAGAHDAAPRRHRRRRRDHTPTMATGRWRGWSAAAAAAATRHPLRRSRAQRAASHGRSAI